LLKDRISRVIPGADYWFVKFLLVYAVAFLINWHTSVVTIWHNDCKSGERICTDSWISYFGPFWVQCKQIIPHLLHVLIARGKSHRGLVLEIELDRAGFAQFFFDTRKQAGDWRGTGVREVQRAVDADCSKGLLSFDSTECTWCPEGIEF
jgi:hypothetical protein